MPKRYSNQSHRITAKTDMDITNATVARFEYTKPDGTEGTWQAAIKDGWILYYDAGLIGENWEINQAGKWVFQGYVEMSDQVWRSNKFNLTFYEP